MIKLEAAHIEEVRGIRKLDIDFNRNTFSIWGPNGSGKSGVIDAIEFGLTGQIGRLTGKGTKGLTVSEHGPHVDKTKFADAAFVKLRVFLPSLKKTVTITRKISDPRKPTIVPDNAEIKAILAQVEEHPELTLSRREILRFILVEPTKRSDEIQAILKMEEVGQTRSAFNTAQNKLQTEQRTAKTHEKSKGDALQRHLEITTWKASDLLEAVNKRREVLGLQALTELASDKKIDEGIETGSRTTEFNKISALKDLNALNNETITFPEIGQSNVKPILLGIERLERDGALLSALQHRVLVEKGLELIEGPDCPLCDTSWDSEERLREHLKAKLDKSEEASKLKQELLTHATGLSQEAIRVLGLIRPVQAIAERQKETVFAQILTAWTNDLESLKSKLTDLDGVLGLKNRLMTSWLDVPKTLKEDLLSLTTKIDALPDQTATIAAQTFLITAQLRLEEYREAKGKNKQADRAAELAKSTYDIYCNVLEKELNKLYEDVQDDFSTFYRAVNEDDEKEFTAKLTPSEGSLNLEVNFYDRGLFPPAAYHSEGHQDGMGVCLYLALMKRLFGTAFSIALLDDVVMSVDTGHRYEFCKLLKTHFPDTQFIITTHDRLWAEQMKSAGLVTSKTALSFHGWSVDTGPLVESNVAIWEEINAALDKGKVEVAASTLRRHLEYVSWHVADQVGAAPQFRADGNYELGDLLPAVLKRTKDLYGKAAEAAQSWGNNTAKEAAVKCKDALTISNGAMNVEQWAVNKAIHYNQWANFGKKDFAPVVIAFKELLDCLRCAACDAWLYVTPRTKPEALRCPCSAVNLNLKQRPK